MIRSHGLYKELDAGYVFKRNQAWLGQLMLHFFFFKKKFFKNITSFVENFLAFINVKDYIIDGTSKNFVRIPQSRNRSFA